MVWLCNPNNPTGEVRDKKYLTELIAKHPRVCFVIDQSYEYFTLNQAFFTLSLGVAAMEIFGSYMGKYHTLAGEGLRICALDTFVAIMAGLIIFPAGSIPPGNSQILQQSCYTKNHLSAKIELFRLLFNERKGDFNGISNKFYGTY